MVMTVRKLPFVMPDAVGIAPLDLTDQQLRILKFAGLRAWWRADTLFDATAAKWQDRAFSRTMVPGRTALPTVETPASTYNGKKVLRFGASTATLGELYDPTDVLLPLSDSWTVVWVGDAGASGFSPFWGNGLTTPTGTFVQHRNSTNLIGFTVGGTQVVVTAAAVPRGPVMGIASFSYSATAGQSRARLDISPGAISLANTAVSVANQNTEFHVGSVGPAGNTSFVNLGGAQAETLVFNGVAMLEAGNETNVADLKDYLRTRYSIST